MRRKLTTHSVAGFLLACCVFLAGCHVQEEPVFHSRESSGGELLSSTDSDYENWTEESYDFIPVEEIRILYMCDVLGVYGQEDRQEYPFFSAASSFDQLQELLRPLSLYGGLEVGENDGFARKLMSFDGLIGLFSAFSFSEKAVVIVQLPPTSSSFSARIDGVTLSEDTLRIECVWGPENLKAYSEDMSPTAVLLPVPKKAASRIEKVSLEERELFHWALP